MLAMILIAAALALLFSRTVTQRLRILTQGVRHLAAGNFNTRVDIRSRDEFGELGRVFNTIGCDLSDINHQLCLDVGDSGRFMTLFYAQFDFQAKSVRWVRAGHDPAIVYDPHMSIFEELGGQGMAMGVSKNVAYAEYRREIRPEQIFVFGTDGLWETQNIKGELFGKERLREIVRAQAGKSAKAIKEAILNAVQNFRGARKQEDDITLVIVKVEY